MTLALLALLTPQVTWRPSFDAAIDEARRTNKAAMVLFYADW